MKEILVGQELRTANYSPGQCDIAKVIALTKDTAGGGEDDQQQEELSEAVEFARQTAEVSRVVDWARS